VSGREGERGLSVVCVFNDPEVRQECLDRSLSDYRGEVAVDYVPVDNTRHTFPTAGAALGAGVARARHEVVVLVHQDVYLHDVDRLGELAETLLADRSWGVLGANGVTAGGRSTGLVRDRVQLIGDAAPTPVEVDSLDEVLFMVRRELLLEHPLTQDADLAWHAYAVELGLRYADLGLKVGAVDAAITHNSLTINLARLDVAHRRVAELYPGRGVIRTTCGAVGASEPPWRRSPVVRRHGWRLRWLKLSRRAWGLRRGIRLPVVISDIRHEVDLLTWSVDTPLELVNLDRGGSFARAAGRRVVLTRLRKPVAMRAVRDLAGLSAVLDDVPADSDLLLEGLSEAEVAAVAQAHPRRTWLAGVSDGELWLLGGGVATELPGTWGTPRAVPLGLGRELAALVH